MRATRFRSIAMFALLASLACSGDGNEPSPGPVNLAGVWVFEESLKDPALGATCRDIATVTLSQFVVNFGGRASRVGVCAIPGRATRPFDDSIIVTGTVSGTAVSLAITPCSYRGHTYGPRTDSITGSMSCLIQEQGVALNLRGQWRMRPAGSPAIPGGGDTLSPLVAGLVPGLQAIAAGDSIHLRVGGGDLLGLAWLGYRINDPHGHADSTAVEGATAQVAFAIPAESAWVGATPPIAIFARNLNGRQGTGAIGGLTIGFRPTVTAVSTATAYFSGEPLRIIVHASDDQGLAGIGYRYLDVSGLPGTEDSVAVSGRQVIDTLILPPDFIELLPYEIFARDEFGLTGRDTVTFFVAPVPFGAFGTASDSIYGVGEQLSVAVQADAGNGALAWMGSRLGGTAGLADSTPATPTGTVSLSTGHTIPSSWLGSIPVIGFARSQAGGFIEDTLAIVRIVQFAPHGVQTLALPDTAGGFAFDPARNRLYLSLPTSPRIAVVDLGSMTLAAPIALPMPPQSGANDLDLTPGGDSLAVPLSSLGAIAIINLVSGQTDTVSLDGLANPIMPQFAYHLRVAANNKVFTSLTFGSSGTGANLVEYDLAAGTQKVRMDAGRGGSLNAATRLAHSGDGSRVLLVEDGGVPAGGQVYDATSNAFDPEVVTVHEFGPSISGDATGKAWLIGSGLFGADLTPIRDLSPESWVPAVQRAVVPGPSVLSPDGTIAYFGTGYGFASVNALDGTPRESVRLPIAPTRLGVSPDGNSLVAISGATLVLVDLR